MRILHLVIIAAIALTTPLSYSYAAVKNGVAAPDFTAVDSNGNQLKLSDQHGKIVVLEWKNHLCPFVRKHYGSGDMQALQKELTTKGVVWWSVISSAPGKQGNVTAQQANDVAAQEKSHASAIILDPQGDIGRLYGAKTTPHMFVIAADGTLAYQGAIDNETSPYPDDVATVNYVHSAVNSLIAGDAVETPITPPYGCSVKY